MIMVKNCFACGERIGLPGDQDYVMICPQCFAFNACRWDQATRPLHHTDIMLMELKTRLVLQAVALEAQLQQLVKLKEIA